MGLRKIQRPMTSTSASMTLMSLRGNSIRSRLVQTCKPLPICCLCWTLLGSTTLWFIPEFRNSHIQWQSQTAHRPSSLKKLAHRRHANIISPTLEDATDTRRACRHNDDLAHNHRVRTEGKRFIQLEHERLGHELFNDCVTRTIPCGRVNDGMSIIKRREADVEMVETRINELDRMHRDFKQPGKRSMRGKVRTESIPGQQAAAKWEGITTTLKVEIACANQFYYFTAASLEPLRGVE